MLKIDSASGVPAAGARTTLQDVGRDPYFLNALQATADNGPASSRPGMTDTARGAMPGASTQNPMTAATAGGSTAAVPAAAPTATHAGTPATALPGGMAPARSPAPTAETAFAHPPAVTDDSEALRRRLREQRPVQHWTREYRRLVAREDGVDVLLRNYFLDEHEQAALVADVLAELAQQQRRPARIYLNGNPVWPPADRDTKNGE